MELIDRKRLKNGEWQSIYNSWSDLVSKNMDVDIANQSIDLKPIDPIPTERLAFRPIPEKLNGEFKPEQPEKKSIDWKEIGSNALNAIPGTLGLVQHWMGVADPGVTAESLVDHARSTTAYTNGVGYQKKYLDPLMLRAKNGKLPGFNLGGILSSGMAGAGAGSVFGPWGTAIGAGVGMLGGLFASNSAEEKAREAQEMAMKQINMSNAYNRDTAWATGQQIYNDKMYDSNKGRLGFKDGKLPGHKHGVLGAFGYVDGKANAMGAGGEGIISADMSSILEIPGARDQKDNNPIYLRKGDGVITKDSMDYIKAGGDVDTALMMDAIKRINKGKGIGYKNGRLPGFLDGDWANLSAALLGGAASLLQYKLADSGTPSYRINTRNTLGDSAIHTMAQRRVPFQPIIDGVYRIGDASRYSIQNSALSTQDKARMLTTLGLGQLRNLTNAYLGAYDLANKYLADEANIKATIGASNADRESRLTMWGIERSDMAGANSNLGKQTAYNNMYNVGLQYLHNYLLNKMHKENLARYESNHKLDLAKLDAYLKANGIK